MADSGRAPQASAEGRDLLTRDFDLTTLRSLRHQVERQARENGLADLALHRFVVAVNEIVTNAVRHGGGIGRLHLWREHDRLRCRVTDNGTGLSVRHRPRRPGPHETSGRGLWLAYRNLDDLNIDSGSTGTTVTLSTRTAGGRRPPSTVDGSPSAGPVR